MFRKWWSHKAMSTKCYSVWFHAKMCDICLFHEGTRSKTQDMALSRLGAMAWWRMLSSRKTKKESFLNLSYLRSTLFLTSISKFIKFNMNILNISECLNESLSPNSESDSAHHLRSSEIPHYLISMSISYTFSTNHLQLATTSKLRLPCSSIFVYSLDLGQHHNQCVPNLPRRLLKGQTAL